MSAINVVRAWKDEEYRRSLSELERAQLPPNPAGLIDLSDAAMEDVSGGLFAPTALGCGGITFGCGVPTCILGACNPHTGSTVCRIAF